MDAKTTIKETKEAEENDDAEKKTTGAESSIFSTILADIEENPTILQNQRKLSAEVSTFTTFLADSDEENPTILQKKTTTPIDLSCTVPKNLRRSYLVDYLNQELKILKSELKSKGQTSGLSRNPNYGRECGDCVEERKVEKHEKGKFLAAIDEFIEELLGKIEKDGSYLEQTKYNYDYGDFLEDRIREELRKKADKDEEEISTWISNGEPEAETRVAQEEKKDIKKMMMKKKKKSPVKVKMERTEQESTVTKRDYTWCKRRWYLIEKLRQREENLKKRRAKAVRYGGELSFLVAEFMFLVPTEFLASEMEDFWICLRRFGVNGDDKGTSVIIGKLEEVFEIVIRKKENKERHNVNLLESVFRFDDYIPLCVDAIQNLGKIVWALRRSNQSEKLNLSDLDSLFEDCQRVLMKIELKLAEMKQGMYRSVSADYESFSKTERFGLLSRKVMKRANADNRFGSSMIGCYLIEIWKSLFQAEALQEQRKEE